MNTALLVLLCVVGGVLAVWLHTLLWTRVFRLHRVADEVHLAKTSDGWSLALHRYLPRPRRFQEPVVLFHGLGANRFNFDLAADRSLPRTLAARGFEVWLVELRGAGLSSRPGLFSPYSWRYDFDDHLFKDVPAALAHIRATTGGGGVFWIGHSLGGMLGYAHLGLRGDHGIKGLITIASPVLLRAARELRVIRPLLRLLALRARVHFRPVARFASPFFGWTPGYLSRIVVARNGMEGALLRRAMVNLVDNTTGGVLRQLATWIKEGSFRSRDRQHDFLANLARIQEPVFILAADKDHVAPPETVTPAYERVGSEDKQVRVFGTDRGDEEDFGHGDILIGSRAPAVVHREILAWLKARATRVSRSGPGAPASTPDPAPVSDSIP